MDAEDVWLEQEQLEQSPRKDDMKTVDDYDEFKHDSYSMQKTMTLKRSKKEKKRMDKEDAWEEQEVSEKNIRKEDMKTVDDDKNSKHDNHGLHETLAMTRSKKEIERVKERKSSKSKDKAKRKYIEKEEYCAEHTPPPPPPIPDSSPCDCPAHVHDRESPLKIAEVSLGIGDNIGGKSKVLNLVTLNSSGQDFPHEYCLINIKALHYFYF